MKQKIEHMSIRGENHQFQQPHDDSQEVKLAT
jgi:hypothetical protein